jgi:hypothetical protein
MLMAGFSLGNLTQAQEQTDTLLSTPVSTQKSAQDMTPSGDTAYGGVGAGQSASGTTTKPGGGTARNCTPLPFCNIYSGGQ